MAEAPTFGVRDRVAYAEGAGVTGVVRAVDKVNRIARVSFGYADSHEVLKDVHWEDLVSAEAPAG